MTNPLVIEGYKKLAGAVVLEAIKDSLGIGIQGKPKELRNSTEAKDRLRTQNFALLLTVMPSVTPEAIQEFVKDQKYSGINKRQKIRTALTYPYVKKEGEVVYTSKNMTVHSGILRVAEPA